MSVDDGFTAIPNELLLAMAQFHFTQRQYAVLLAVIQKTLSWRKEMDWICNEQLCELTDIKGEHKVSAVKNELIRMNVLIQKGRKIGVNFAVSEWEKPNLPEKGNITQKRKSNLPKKGNQVYPNQGTTKETITKEKINITPLPPKAKNRKAERIDYQRIADLFNRENEDTGSRLPMVVALNDKRKRDIKKFLGELKAPTAEYAENYFSAFFENLKPFHMGENNRGWRADFDYAIRPSTVLKVREGNL
ncbi:replication protein [Actinobacillus seminis]|uniref:replication protein n=1 Tax=Actinobacillus seminis TaxID=722 RepID=UPI003B92FBB8